jgi:hypothetical protein
LTRSQLTLFPVSMQTGPLFPKTVVVWQASDDSSQHLTEEALYQWTQTLASVVEEMEPLCDGQSVQPDANSLEVSWGGR